MQVLTKIKKSHYNTVWAACIEGNSDYNSYPVCVDRLLKIAIVTCKQCVDSLLMTIVIATLTLCGFAIEDSNCNHWPAWILYLK